MKKNITPKLLKKSISFKLFLITSAFFLSFIFGTMYFQSTFFEDFYTNRKAKSFEQNINKLNAFYSNDFISQASLQYVLFQFEASNNAKLVILDKGGNIKYDTGIEDKSDISKFYSIYKVYNNLVNSPEVLNSIVSTQKTYVDHYYDNQFNVENIVCISPVVIDNNTTDIILAVSSLQPIEEASNVIKEFYRYILVGALLIAIMLSLIYSNMISKPLIRLNKVASKMADMDFSVDYEVKSEDELGSLASTLNFLSHKLDNALKQLRESNLKLQEDIEKERHLERMRKDFVAGVSHELKTPIALISGYAEGLKDNVVDGDSRDFYIDVIMDEANKMSSLVSDMLDLSQFESGNYKLKPEPFALDELIYTVVKKHLTFVQEKGIKLCVDLTPPVSVFADITRIEQVLTNFITNAIRHTPEKGHIDIRAICQDKNVYIEIENNGESIAPSDLKNIWDKFYKIDKSRSRNTGGTGLGLSIVKNILLLHKSSFGVKNTESGVLFYFSLKKYNGLIEDEKES